MISFVLDSASVSAGEVISGRVRWIADGALAVRKIVVAAEWETYGFGNRASGVGRGTTQNVAKNARDATIPFRFLIPHEGPVTFEGELVKIRWKIRVRVDQLGFDELGEAEFKVEPRRRS